MESEFVFMTKSCMFICLKHGHAQTWPVRSLGPPELHVTLTQTIENKIAEENMAQEKLANCRETITLKALTLSEGLKTLVNKLE